MIRRTDPIEQPLGAGEGEGESKGASEGGGAAGEEKSGFLRLRNQE